MWLINPLATHSWTQISSPSHLPRYQKSERKWKWSYLVLWTLCDPMDCSLPCSSICGILQARILEWVAISFSRRSSQPRDRTRVSLIVGRRFTIWAKKDNAVKLERKENHGANAASRTHRNLFAFTKSFITLPSKSNIKMILHFVKYLHFILLHLKIIF